MLLAKGASTTPSRAVRGWSITETRQTMKESAVSKVDTAAITGETPQWMLLYMRTGSVVVWALDRNQAMTTSSNEDRKSTRLNSSHIQKSRMPSSA